MVKPWTGRQEKGKKTPLAVTYSFTKNKNFFSSHLSKLVEMHDQHYFLPSFPFFVQATSTNFNEIKIMLSDITNDWFQTIS